MFRHILKRIVQPFARKRSLAERLADFDVTLHGTFRVDQSPLVAVYKSFDGFSLVEDNGSDRDLGTVPRGANNQMIFAAMRFYYRGYSDAEEDHDIPYPKRMLRYRPPRP